MDKYSIDIDKILNDFEFNELLPSSIVVKPLALSAPIKIEDVTTIVAVSNKPDVVPTSDNVSEESLIINEDAEPEAVTKLIDKVDFNAIAVSDNDVDELMEQLDNEKEIVVEEEEEEVLVENKSRCKRPNTLNIVSNYNALSSSAGSTPFVNSVASNNDTSNEEERNESENEEEGENCAISVSSNEQCVSFLELGKVAPFWTPDNDALNCMHCSLKFTLVKRRHHCRACGLVLCSKCCNMKYFLQYLNSEARICQKCFETFELKKSPPLPQAPAGVLKRENSEHRISKSVTFCDGIKPGHDYSDTIESVALLSPLNKEPHFDTITKSYIPSGEEMYLPPIVVSQSKLQVNYEMNVLNNGDVVERVRSNVVIFALQKNFYVHVKIVELSCCVGKFVWSFMSEGLIFVGQDEIVYVLECNEELDRGVPFDIFLHYNDIYKDAVRGKTVTELCLSLNPNLLQTDTSDPVEFLDSKEHAGFIYIRRTYQCVQNILLPKNEPCLIGVLIHKWEIPWAKILPLRLILRLGALTQLYPTSIVSVRQRDSVYAEIGHTIIKILADFRDFSYTLPAVKGLTAYMESNNVEVSIPKNCYNQLLRIMDESSDHILAFAANFCASVDSHLVCVQNFDADDFNNGYSTQAISIINQERRKTGISFLVFNGVLKSNSGLKAKSTIVEDGLMVQITSEQMCKLRESLRNLENFEIACGPLSDDENSDELVRINWIPNDKNFNIGVTSPIDGMSFSGIPSIRVHSGKDYVSYNCNKKLRWTEVFIIQNGDDNCKNYDPVDVSKLAENISEAVYRALVRYLELLASNSLVKIGIRTKFNADHVSYLAGSNNAALSDIYMNSLDNELVPVLHTISSRAPNGSYAVILELIFYVLNT